MASIKAVLFNIMPKAKKLKKICRIQVEWLEPKSRKGQLTTVTAQRIVSYEKGLQVGQQVLCSWGLHTYKAIVKTIGKKGEKLW